MAERAALGIELFPAHSSAPALNYLYFVGKNGWRYLVGVVELINGEQVERRWPPRSNEKTVAYKKALRLRHLWRTRYKEMIRKRVWRLRRAQKKALTKGN